MKRFIYSFLALFFILPLSACSNGMVEINRGLEHTAEATQHTEPASTENNTLPQDAEDIPLTSEEILEALLGTSNPEIAYASFGNQPVTVLDETSANLIIDDNHWANKVLYSSIYNAPLAQGTCAFLTAPAGELNQPPDILNNLDNIEKYVGSLVSKPTGDKYVVPTIQLDSSGIHSLPFAAFPSEEIVFQYVCIQLQCSSHTIYVTNYITKS